MFEARIVNPPDSGAAGGLGYSKYGNNAQSGDTTSIQLATAESFAESDILGLTLICLSDNVFDIITFNKSSVGKSIPISKKLFILDLRSSNLKLIFFIEGTEFIKI